MAAITTPWRTILLITPVMRQTLNDHMISETYTKTEHGMLCTLVSGTGLSTSGEYLYINHGLGDDIAYVRAREEALLKLANCETEIAKTILWKLGVTLDIGWAIRAMKAGLSVKRKDSNKVIRLTENGMMVDDNEKPFYSMQADILATDWVLA